MQDLLELLQVHLAKVGHRVRIYQSGQEMLAAVRAKAPTVAVIDTRQNDVSAWDLCRQLRELEHFAHHPLLLLSTDPEDEERAFRLQIDAFLQKPFSLQQFSDCIQGLLKRSPILTSPNGVQDEDSGSGG